jgi:hypothetical protein
MDGAVQALDRVGGGGDLADRRVEGEERDHFLSSPPPSRGDRRVFPSPFSLESVQLDGGLVCCRGAVDRA